MLMLQELFLAKLLKKTSKLSHYWKMQFNQWPRLDRGDFVYDQPNNDICSARKFKACRIIATIEIT